MIYLIVIPFSVVVCDVDEYINAIRVKGTWMGFGDCEFVAEMLQVKITLLDFSPDLNEEYCVIIFGQRNAGSRMLR